MATLVLVQLAAYTGDDRYAAAAEAALRLMAENAATMPLGFAQWLVAFDLYLAPPVEVAIIGDGTPWPRADAAPGDVGARQMREAAGTTPGSLLAVVRSAFRPHVLVAAAPDAAATSVPLLAGRTANRGEAAAYVCRHFTCDAPVTDAGDLGTALAR